MKTFLSLMIVLIQFVALSQMNDFKHRVARKGNRVYLTGFTPIKQVGGTCATYSGVMLIRYYGLTDTKSKMVLMRRKDKNAHGEEFSRRMKKLGFEFCIFSETVLPKMAEIILWNTIDQGIPLDWYCDLNQSPILRERKPGKYAGHGRLITGYTTTNGKITGVLYSDSWGEGHLHKEMSLDDAVKMTKTWVVWYKPSFTIYKNDMLTQLDELCSQTIIDWKKRNPQKNKDGRIAIIRGRSVRL